MCHIIESERFVKLENDMVDLTPEFYPRIREITELYGKQSLKVRGCMHSHPSGDAMPSQVDLKHFPWLFGNSNKHTHIIVAIDKAGTVSEEDWKHVDINKMRKTFEGYNIVVSSWFTSGYLERFITSFSEKAHYIV